MLIILDGPEKAGKSTIARALIEQSSMKGSIRKWGPINGNDCLYLYALQEDALKVDELIIWDRSYASEAVYCQILPREGRLGRDSFYGEWVYGRISQAVGRRYMVLGPNVDTLERLRDDTDHKCSVEIERRSFKDYASMYHWIMFTNTHNESALMHIVDKILTDVNYTIRSLKQFNTTPPRYVGPQNPKVLILGEPPRLSPRPRHLDSWAPFGLWLTSQLGYALGPPGLMYGWSNITWCAVDFIRSIPTVVACGVNVQRWLRENVFNAVEYEGKVIPTYHPAWLFRYADGLDKSEGVISKLKGEIAKCQAKNPQIQTQVTPASNRS